MKRVLLFIVIAGVGLVALAFSFNGKSEKTAGNSELITIQGQVLDHRTNEALVGVKVTLDGTNKVAYTDFDGNYCFDQVQAGAHELTASYISYEQSIIKDLPLNKSINQVNIRLEDSH